MLRLILLLLAGLAWAEDKPRLEERINCYPEQIGSNSNPWRISFDQCNERECFYDTDVKREFAPICFMHPNHIGLKVTSMCENCDGNLINAELEPMFPNAKIFDPSIKHLRFTMKILKDYHLQFKIIDRDNQRYEVPFDTPTPFQPSGSATKDTALFKVEYNKDPFWFKVIRKSTGTVIFDTSIGGMYFSNRFLQIATRVPSWNLYGIGEQEHPSLRHSFEYKTWPMFARDQPGLGEGLPLYGTYPIYQVLEDDGNAHGVFLMNSNAMEYTLIPAPGVVMKAIGGVLDYHIYLGPTPENVVQQHTEFVGRPYMPPYWAFGFQLARWGYNSLNGLKAAVDRTRTAAIPLDVVYADIDHMDKNMDFTYDHANWDGMPQYMSWEREHYGLHTVIIIDPAVMESGNYYPWQVLSGNDTFIKWQDGSVMMGAVWPPGKVAFPDFFLEKTHDVWRDLIVRHSKVLPFDGIWIDMNEPANFGTNEEKPWNWPSGWAPWSLKCPRTDYDDPPFRTTAISRFDWWNGQPGRMSDKTICMEGTLNHGQYKLYDTHSLYGWTETKATYKALEATYPGKRPFIVSRSTFSGSSSYATHWLGDNVANWSHLRRSIIAMLEMSIFGMPHTGADICGFLGNSWGELCKRWMQLGAFYPYSRNHNTAGTPDQDPGVFGSDVTGASRYWMRVRYNILPYMYTLFYYAHTQGSTAARPLYFEFPAEDAARYIDTQFMLGNALMIAPILDSGYSPLRAYMPKARWINYAIPAKVMDFCNPTGSQYVTFQGNYDISVFQRGGTIIPAQGINEGPIFSTQFTRLEPFSISVLFDCNDKASGTLFWDDGESSDSIRYNNYWLISYTAEMTSNQIKFNVKIDHKASNPSLGADLYYEAVTFHGVQRPPGLYSVKCTGDSSCGPVASGSSYNADGKLRITLDYSQPTLGKSFEIVVNLGDD